MNQAELEKVRLLEEAFQRFNLASSDLEKTYQSMGTEVRQLRAELQKSSAENEALREQAERNLRLASAGEMAARMAHELRNPLGSIELFAGLLRQHLKDDPEKRQWAVHISSAVSAMDYALTNLLLFTGKPRPALKVYDCRQMIEEARVFSLPLLAQNRVHFEIRLSPPAFFLECDELLMKQVFLNLIINAVEAMPEGGTLTISGGPVSEFSGKMVRIRFSDTGPGIPDEIREKIFDPFFTTKSRGTGLGLSIVHNAVSAHGGTVSVDSSPREGSIFTITLPAETGLPESGPLESGGFDEADP